MRVAKVKPLSGQMSLLDELPVRYCPVCGRRLTSPRSHRRGVGPGCRKKTKEATEHPQADRQMKRMLKKVRMIRELR